MRISLLVIFLWSFSACSLAGSPTVAPLQKPVELPENYTPARFAKYAEVQSVFDNRCVVCHGCYDAPCQLKLGSFAGVDRGASKNNPYADRIIPASPTRLGIDATSSEQWRNKGFFSVLHRSSSPAESLERSLLFRLVEYRRENPLPQVNFDSAKSRRCLNPENELDLIQGKILEKLSLTTFTDLGMPYGMPGLSDREFEVVRDWVASGAPGPGAPPPLTDSLGEEINRWEKFLNAQTAKQKLVSRYLYEHLFLGHLFFEEEGRQSPTFFRLVRSRTLYPNEIDEIATPIPYHAPGVRPFFYRFKRIEETIVRKTHIVYPLNRRKLRRFNELFLTQDWDLREEDLPDYDARRSANPFKTFERIPARARYQFLLDNAEFFVMNFIRGPVCRGQIALNVIQDHFFIFFLNPDADVSVTDPTYLPKAARYLYLPWTNRALVEGFEKHGAKQLVTLLPHLVDKFRADYYPRYKERQLKYLKLRDTHYSTFRPLGHNLQDIWDGDGVNTNAVLTVFRHFDNAEVLRGAVGGMPKTSIILDYPIFERMFYNLVANFDLFGSISHQLATRLYYNNLRIEGEDNFLSFLPLEQRRAIRSSWYVGVEDEIWSDEYPLYGTTHGTPRGSLISYSQADTKAELISLILNKHLDAKVTGGKDMINRGPVPSNTRVTNIKTVKDFELGLRTVTAGPGAFTRLFPDTAMIRLIHSRQNPEKGSAYTLIRNRAHFHIQHLFREGSRLDPENDVLNVIPGFAASYPNYFFRVHLDQAHQFLQQLKSLDGSTESWNAFITDFGISRRNDLEFWETSDWFKREYYRLTPIEAGILDLNRYENY